MKMQISIYEIIGRYVMVKQEYRTHIQEGHSTFLVKNETSCGVSPGECFIASTLRGRVNELEQIIRSNNDGELPAILIPEEMD